jgi:hypothetical protein
MAKNEEFPIAEQRRFPKETAANMKIMSNYIPRQEINSNTTFPMPIMAPAGNDALAYQDQDAEFIFPSHTDGKKK